MSMLSLCVHIDDSFLSQTMEPGRFGSEGGSSVNRPRGDTWSTQEEEDIFQPESHPREDILEQTQTLDGADVQLGDSSRLIFEGEAGGAVLRQSDLDYITGHSFNTKEDSAGCLDEVGAVDLNGNPHCHLSIFRSMGVGKYMS